MRILAVVSTLSLFAAGCNDSTQATKHMASEAIKSNDQIQAEQLCTQATADNEARRTPGLKKILCAPSKTQSLGPNHYLVRVTYKMVTLDDPGTTSDDLNSYSAATCEVKQGMIVTGKLDDRLVDIIQRQR